MSLITTGVSQTVTNFALRHGFGEDPMQLLELAELEEMSPTDSFDSSGGETIPDLDKVASEIGVSPGAIVRAIGVQGYYNDLSAIRAGEFNLSL